MILFWYPRFRYSVSLLTSCFLLYHWLSSSCSLLITWKPKRTHTGTCLITRRLRWFECRMFQMPDIFHNYLFVANSSQSCNISNQPTLCFAKLKVKGICTETNLRIYGWTSPLWNCEWREGTIESAGMQVNVSPTLLVMF